MSVAEFSGHGAEADDRRAALAACVATALGRLSGRATATVDEVAELFGVGRATAYEAVRRGDVPSLHLGRRIVVPMPALVALLLGVEPHTHFHGDAGWPVERRRDENPGPMSST